jgi:hypothetical protein
LPHSDEDLDEIVDRLADTHAPHDLPHQAHRTQAGHDVDQDIAGMTLYPMAVEARDEGMVR